MSRLVLIGGPPGVGKTSVLAHLERAFERCACLDADDVRRIRPLELGDTARQLVERTILAVLRGYFELGAPLVFLAWVLANPLLVERVLRGLEGHYESVLLVHLVATPEVIRERCARQAERPRPVAYALQKLEEIRRLPTPKIDTSGLTSEEVAQRIIALVDGGVARGSA